MERGGRAVVAMLRPDAKANERKRERKDEGGMGEGKRKRGRERGMEH